MTIQPNFDKWASHYNTATPIQQVVANSLARLIVSHVPQHNWYATWLDIGCGTGKLSQALLQQAGLENLLSLLEDNPYLLTWYGLDNSANMLAIFEQNVGGLLPKNTHASCQTLLADMQSIPLPTASMTYIISSFALHWLGKGGVETMTAEIGRVLAKNGQIHVAIPVAGSLLGLKQRCPTLPIYPFPSAEAWLENVDRLVQARGGRWLYQQNQHVSHSYPNVRTLLKQLKQMGGTFVHNERSPYSAIKNLRGYLSDPRPIDLDYQVLLLGLQLT